MIYSLTAHTLHSASAESNEERRKIIALRYFQNFDWAHKIRSHLFYRTGSSIRICIEYLWKCDLDLLYYGDTVLLLTDVVEEFKPFGMYSVMHSSLTNTLQVFKPTENIYDEADVIVIPEEPQKITHYPTN